MALLVLLASLVLPQVAFAHATLVSSTPADGAALEAAPQALRLVFNEPVAATSLRLAGPDGTAAALGPPKATGETVEVAIPAALAPGGYVLSYRIVSEDGHPVAGAVAFSVGAGVTPTAVTTAEAGLGRATWAARVALYVGLMFGAGGAFARAWLELGGGRRAVGWSLAAGLAAAPIALALQGLDLTALSIADLATSTPWRAAFGTSFAVTVAIAIAALLAAGASLRSGAGAAKAVSLIGMLGAGAALAASGHASAAAPQWLMRPAVFVHAVAAAFWMGALVPLAASHGVRLTDGLRRFSAAAPFAVAALLLAGVALAVVQVERVAALWTTDYGMVLSAKVALVAALLVLAALNRWRWTRPALADDGGAIRSLSRMAAAELVVGAVILGVVGLWRFTPPPRALAPQAIETTTRLQSRGAQADVVVSRRGGPASATLTLRTGEGGRLEPREVVVVVSNPEAGIEPIRRQANPLEDGRWRAEALPLTVPGRWRLRIDVLVTDFDSERLEGEIDAPP